MFAINHRCKTSRLSLIGRHFESTLFVQKITRRRQLDTAGPIGARARVFEAPLRTSTRTYPHTWHSDTPQSRTLLTAKRAAYKVRFKRISCHLACVPPVGVRVGFAPLHDLKDIHSQFARYPSAICFSANFNNVMEEPTYTLCTALRRSVAKDDKSRLD